LAINPEIKIIFFYRGESKKKLQGGKPEMTYITGGKNLLTQSASKLFSIYQVSA